MAGDGNFSSKQYYTASEQLRDDVCRLAMSLGVKPRYLPNGGHWTVSLRRTRDQLHGRQLESEPTDCEHVCLAVEDYPIVLAGRNGKYQWLGVSWIV
jgi:DNA polymerase I